MQTACMGVVDFCSAAGLWVCVMHAFVFGAGSEHLHMVALDTPQQQLWRPIQLTYMCCVQAEASFTGWWHS
jgi:hypothetical protein